MNENIVIEKSEIIYYFNIKGIYNALKNCKKQYKIDEMILNKIFQKCQEWMKTIPEFYILSKNELSAWIDLSQAVE